MNNFKVIALKKIESQSAWVTRIGLGYVGLPLMLCFAERGYSVLGIDIDEKKIDREMSERLVRS